MAHDHEQHPIEQAQRKQHDDEHHPLCARDPRKERRDVVVDLEHRLDRPGWRAQYGDIGREQIAVFDHSVERAELVAVGQLAGDPSVAGALKAGVRALVLADLPGLGREHRAAAHVVHLYLGHRKPLQKGQQRSRKLAAVRMIPELVGGERARGREILRQRRLQRVGQYPREGGVVRLPHRDQRMNRDRAIEHAQNDCDDEDRDEARQGKVAQQSEHRRITLGAAVRPSPPP